MVFSFSCRHIKLFARGQGFRIIVTAKYNQQGIPETIDFRTLDQQQIAANTSIAMGVACDEKTTNDDAVIVGNMMGSMFLCLAFDSRVPYS